VTEQMISLATCHTVGCGHDINLHGARATVPPGRCLAPGCPCERWTPRSVIRFADPRSDPSLRLRLEIAVQIVAEKGTDPAALTTSLHLIYDAVLEWERTAVFALPPAPGALRAEGDLPGRSPSRPQPPPQPSQP